MIYVIGLGNPGKQYEETAHNIGRSILKQIVRDNQYDFSPWEKNKKSLVSYGELGSCHRVAQLILPETFMNLSGEVVNNEMKDKPEHVIAVYDDIDLPFGDIRVSINRGSGGHNGIKSLEKYLQSRNFVRIRVGVCPIDWFGNARKPQSKQAVTKYLVNKKLSRWYTGQYQTLASEVLKRLQSLSCEEVHKTMNRFN